MAEPSLTPAQIRILEAFLRAGFRFLTLERYARYIVVEKNGFVAVLDPADGKLELFSQAGYLMDDGIGMLVDKPEGKAFVCHGESVPATGELLAAYDRFKSELHAQLETLE